jgi:D-alanine-D-alanine ligase-like ATP-grasp enzyme
MRLCPDCNEPTSHSIDYLGALLDTTLLPLTSFVRRFSSTKGSPNRGKTFVKIYTLLERLHMGCFLEQYDSKTLLLDQVLWDEAKKRGIVMREFRLFNAPKALFIATLPGGRVLDFDGVPMPKARAVWWINNKSTLKKKFAAAGLPVPKGGSAATLHGARTLFNRLQKPVIVKPSIGSASRHTYLHIHTEAELQRAFLSAKKLSPFVMIEEELTGAVYRPTLVTAKLIATLRRDQPCVWGDGVKTVKELVADENKNAGRQGLYFRHIQLDAAAEAELQVQGLNTESIPALGKRVQLNQKINWSLGGTTTDVTGDVHPDNKKLFEEVAQFLHAPLVGIDFIIEDISKSWKSQSRCGIIECNDMPYFDNHHLPYKGAPRNVAGPIWDLVTK